MANGNVNSVILTIAIQVTINTSKNPTRKRLFLQLPSGVFRNFRESLRKNFPWNFALENKQMLAYKFTEKDLYCRSFALNKL